MKKRVNELKLEKKIRINQSGCLDKCELGPIMVIYPEEFGIHLKIHRMLKRL